MEIRAPIEMQFLGHRSEELELAQFHRDAPCGDHREFVTSKSRTATTPARAFAYK